MILKPLRENVQYRKVVGIMAIVARARCRRVELDAAASILTVASPRLHLLSCRVPALRCLLAAVTHAPLTLVYCTQTQCFSRGFRPQTRVSKQAARASVVWCRAVGESFGSL
jgi:hypothetical protein